MTSALSCDQLCPITADHMALMISALMISVAPSVPPVSVHQCHLSVPINATCQYPSVPHQCYIAVPTSAHQCHISVPI
ncbi:unnamed protein product [Staurois parvus]|uniref:Uncharacterized protein n=1 Tax=Staurois parvus TaxID=386267 RepID=A0ABN9GSU4_9NEOB|nr:unnamed protein product [Staurois parvus]